MPSSSIRGEHPAQALRQELERCMTQKDVNEQRFVSKKAIERFWPDDLKGLKAKLGLRSWSVRDHELLSLLDQECRIIICILAWIRYKPFSEKLKEIALAISKEKETEAEAELKDSRLILEEDVCVRLLDFQSGRLFYQDQFIFCPILISSTRKGVHEVHPSRRWPYRSFPTEIGFGAFGSVSKVLVVKGQLQDTAGHSNDEDKPVAFKSVNKSADWRKEVKTLDFLKESLSEHKRLTLHIAAFIQGGKFYIFMPYTPLGDLENFLQEGAQHDENHGDLYDFSQTFSNFGILDLAREFALVIDATAYLHDRVSSARGIAVFCAHADLRPTNILIFPGDQDHPAGVWRISDFGISSVKLEDDQKLPEPVYAREPAYAKDHPSMGDIIEGRWNPSGSQSTVRKLNGTHVAPERSISRIYKPRESDVWSLGCILMEVLCFGLGTQQKGNRRKELGKFRAERTSFQGADRDDYFFDVDNVRMPAGSSHKITIVRRLKVDEWLKYVSKENGLLCRELAVTVHKMLQPNPDARCRAKTAYEAILKACNNHDNEPSILLDESSLLYDNAEILIAPAEPWQFLANSDSSANLTFVEDIGQSDQEKTAPRAGAASQRGKNIRSQSSGIPDSPIAPELSQFQRTQTFHAHRGSMHTWSEDASGLLKPAMRVRVSSSRGMAVYLCLSPERTDPTGSLSSRKGYAYELRFRQVWQPASDFMAPRPYELPLNVEWRELHVDGHYATVSGRQVRSNATVAHVYDFARQSEVSIPSTSDIWQMRKFIASVRGVFIAYDDKQFTRWQSDGSSTPYKVSPPMGAHGQVTFGRTGTFLFTWSCKHQEDIISVWFVPSDTRLVVCATYLVPRPARRAPLSLLLYPCGSLPACVLRDGSGTWFTVSAHPGFSRDRAPVRAVEQHKPGPDIPQSDVLCVANEHHFFYLSSRSEVRVCDLVWNDDTILQLQPKSDPLCRIGLRNAKSMGLCTQQDGTNVLLICNHEGAIESIEIKY